MERVRANSEVVRRALTTPTRSQETEEAVERFLFPLRQPNWLDADPALQIAPEEFDQLLGYQVDEQLFAGRKVSFARNPVQGDDVDDSPW